MPLRTRGSVEGLGADRCTLHGCAFHRWRFTWHDRWRLPRGDQGRLARAAGELRWRRRDPDTLADGGRDVDSPAERSPTCRRRSASPWIVQAPSALELDERRIAARVDLERLASVTGERAPASCRRCTCCRFPHSIGPSSDQRSILKPGGSPNFGMSNADPNLLDRSVSQRSTVAAESAAMTPCSCSK